MSDTACKPWLSCAAALTPGVAHALGTVVVGFPLDTAKTRVQVGMHTSPLRSLYSVALREGPLAVYRGATMPLASLLLKRPCEFAAFEWVNAKCGRRSGGPFFGGLVAGLIAATLGCPFGVVKVQMQTNGKAVYRNAFEACAEVWRARGPLGFYRGYSASLVMNVPGATLFLGVYGRLRETLPQSRWSTAVASAAASLGAWSCLLPVDNIRTRMQAAPIGLGAGVGPVATGWIGQMRAAAAGPSGVLGLWAGWTVVVIRAPAMSACSMLAYEQARSFADASR